MRCYHCRSPPSRSRSRTRPVCTPYHELCGPNPIDGQHADVTGVGVEARAGDDGSSSRGDRADGDCFHGQAVEVFLPGSGSFVEHRASLGRGPAPACGSGATTLLP